MTRWFLPLLTALAVVAAGCGGESSAGPDGRPAEDRPTSASKDTASPAAAASSPTSTAVAPASPTATVQRGPAEHVGERTQNHITELSSVIGARVSGTDGERRATNYIATEFRAYGYDVEVMSFDFAGYGTADVSIAGSSSLDAVTLSGSASGVVTGRAVFIGLADAEGIAGRDLSGAVAVALRGTLRFAEKYENARAAGAAALIVVNSQSGLFSGSLGAPAAIPVAGVGGEDEARLRGAAASGTALTVSAAAASTGVNVIARSSPGETCRIVVGGHHDTVPGVPGATDNASGASHTLELARAFAADGLDAGLCFVTFGGEESGLFGSRALVERWKAAGSLPAYMVNLDVTATGTFVELIGDADLQALASAIANRLGVEARATILPPNTGSDHQSFATAGVQVIFLAGDDYSNIHTPRDTADRTNAGLVEGLGDVAFETIRQLQARVAQP